MYINIIIIFFIISLCENQTINQAKRRKRKLDESTSNNRVNLTQNSQKITFQNINQPKYLMIWYEDCQLNAEYNNIIIKGENNYIQIPYSNSTEVTITTNYSNELECIFYYETYNENGLTINESINYGFSVDKKLNLSFLVENNTNPSYLLYFNKIGNGDLTIDLNTKDKSEQIIIKDINPYKGIYLNRKNLFELCSDNEPYNCSFNINITGNNISFNLLIMNSHDDPTPSYFPSNKMILGVSESFHTLYFYTPVLKQKGELFINYKRSNIKVYSKLVSENYDIASNWKDQINFSYDYLDRKLSFDASNCTNKCRLYIGIYVNDYNVDDAGEFSFFLRYNDANKKSIVNLKPNEYVFGHLNKGEFDSYQINITKNYMKLYIFFDSDFCEFKVVEDITDLEKEYDIKGNIYTISNIDISTFPYLTFNISTKYSSSSFYSFKIVLVENNKNLIQQINSEIMEYCNITKSTDNCYFAYPLKNYQSSTQITLYAINEKYPFSFFSRIKIKEINFDDLNSVNLNSGFSGIAKNNLLTYNLNNEEKDKYIIISLKSKVPGKIYLLSNIYPNYGKKILFPNSINVLHFLNNDNDKTEILLNPNHTNVEFYDFINLNKISYLSFPTDKERYLNTNSYEYNIIPNVEKKNINYSGEGDFLIRNLNFPIKHNLHYLNFDINETIIFKKYDNVNIFPILIYKKVPFDLTSDLTFEFKINQSGSYSFNYGNSTEENILNFLSGSTNNLTMNNFTDGKIEKNNQDFYNFTLNETEINRLNNTSYICILINSTQSMNSISIQFFEKSNLIELINNDSLTVYTSSKDKIIKTNVRSSKITGFNYPSKEGFYFYRIYFFLPPNFNFFLHPFTEKGNFSNYEDKTNTTFRMFKNNNYGRKKILIIQNNENTNGIRLYFYKNENQRILSDGEISTEIEMKYENKEKEEDLNSYDITSNKLSVKTNEDSSKLITASPVIDKNGNIDEFAEYMLYLYKKILDDDDIDTINEEENAFKSIEGSINNNKQVEFLIKNEGDEIKNQEFKIMLTATVNNDEKINYEIRTINMNSTTNDNPTDSSSSFADNNEFSLKKKKKKKKWWIALIVIGGVIIIALIILLICKNKKSKRRSHKPYQDINHPSKMNIENFSNEKNININDDHNLIHSDNK